MATEVPPNFREGIRDNGTVEGHVVETFYCHLARLELRMGYLAVISDDGAVDAETLIPLGMLREILARSEELMRERGPTIGQLADGEY